MRLPCDHDESRRINERRHAEFCASREGRKSVKADCSREHNRRDFTAFETFVDVYGKEGHMAIKIHKHDAVLTAISLCLCCCGALALLLSTTSAMVSEVQLWNFDCD